LSVQTA